MADRRDGRKEAEKVFITVPKMCEEMNMDLHTAYELAARRDDPLPLRYLKGGLRNGRILEDELREWWLRNSVHYQERGKGA